MLRLALTSLRTMAVILLVLGLAFPLAVTALAQVAFPYQANGSVTAAGGRPVGSELIGQTFASPRYFRPRPSAAGAGYDPNASSASNLGPTSKTLLDSVTSRVATAVAENPGLARGSVPVDMVTASASGLDPDISVANALAQTPRVAAERGLPEIRVGELVARNTSGRLLGFIGEPVVNVLRLNIALDGLAASASHGPLRETKR